MLTPPPATAEQQEAIDYSGGNLLILACAGSGKTETLSRRIVRMILQGQDRGSIVAFTFTEHAAAELKHRIRSGLEIGLPDEPSLGDMYVGTIHSFCLRVLRESDPRYRRYEVMDEARQAALIATNFVRFDDSGSGIGLERLRSQTKSKTYGETLRTFLNTLNVVHQQDVPFDNLELPVLSDAICSYQRLAYDSPNYFYDFNKIIDELINMLESNSERLEELRDSLSHVFVDEYQDVDDRQERLIRLLTGNGVKPNLTVVGDDDQALYGFRGASVKNILSFEERYPNVKQVTLDANFRSTHAIVSIADEAVRKVLNRIDKQPVARKSSDDGVLVERLADRGDVQLQTFESEEEEAKWVAARIKSLRGVAFEQKDGSLRGLDYGDMSILLRSVRGAGNVFSEELRAVGIPVVISGTGGLFNNDEIRLIQASFCLLARSEFAIPDERGRLEFLSTVETREFIRNKIRLLREQLRFGNGANSTHYLSWIDQTRSDLDERALKKEERKKGISARIYPQNILQYMMETLGAKKDEWPADLMFNLGAFSDLLSQFEAVHQWITPSRLKGLTLFLSNWAVKNVDEGGLSDITATNSVQIMTVHAAKGLEWPIVFLPRISSHNFPSSMRTRGPDTFLPKGSFDESIYVGGDDGERRLWYVALTRCAKFLNISSLDRPRKKPTPYFKEINHDCVSKDGTDLTSRKKMDPSPAEGSGLFPTTYSDIATYWRCEHEYQLRSLMGFSPGVGEQFGYGQQLHNILAEIHSRAINGKPVKLSEIDNLVDDMFHLRYTRGAPLDAMKKAAAAGLKRYVEKYGAEILDAQAVEKPFEFVEPRSGSLISGVVDLLERGKPDIPPSQREIVGLVDFKAKQIKTQEEFDETKNSVTEQLQLYALGVHYSLAKNPKKATAHLISHKSLPEEIQKNGGSERIPVDVSPTAREVLLNRISETVSSIQKGISSQTFKRSGANNGKCKICDYRIFCKGSDESLLLGGNHVEFDSPHESREAEIDQLMEDMDAR